MARFVMWCILVAGLLGGQFVWILLLRGPRIIHATHTLIIGQLVFSAMLIAMMWLLATTPPGAIRMSPRASAWFIIAGAAALQTCAVVFLWPGLSEDLARYRLDGRLWLSGISPYATSPDEAFAAKPSRFKPDAVDRVVTYPHMHTIYPPVSQAIFAAAAGVESLVHPGGIEGTFASWRTGLAELSSVGRGVIFRSIFAMAAVGCAAVLVRLLVDAEHSAWWAAIFAWSPLVVLETGGMGHQDIVGVLLMLATVWFARQRRYRAAAAMLALACGVKPLAAMLMPFLMHDAFQRGERRAIWRACAMFVVITGMIYLPPLLHAPSRAGWMDSVRTYSVHWEANGALYEWYKTSFGYGDESGWRMVGAKADVRAYGVCAIALTGLVLLCFRASFPAAAYVMFLVMLLVSPVVYPWYLLWMLCFIPLLRGAGWAGVVWSGTVVLCYRLWQSRAWTLSPNELLAEYLPVALVLLMEIALLILAAAHFIRQRPHHAGALRHTSAQITRR